jgi:proline iminopeptidase
MRLFRIALVAIASAVLAGSAVYFAIVRPKVRNWGFDPAEAELPLPGDGLVPDATAIETRGISIDAPASAVWPWLVQMGFRRAGWYSYDAVDNDGSSSESILPEFQKLAAGEIMPTHPGGGFRVEVVEPEQALVLYIDTDLVKSQQATAEVEGKTDLPTAGLRATGAFGKTAFPDFAASWGFYLRPEGGTKTRLIERFRARTPGQGPASVVLGEVMGTGIVLMTRKQMLGIKERVERAFKAPVDELMALTEPIDMPVALTE